ncbi:MAG: AmmeMemoRadiSam system protein A [Actinobacteria bacterium]|nr:MAG: AmmeMemoRadiSam system protein A [Actinomycetota bacterium]
MERSPLSESRTEQPINETTGELLLQIADRSIARGLDNRHPSIPGPAHLPADLQRPLGSFVTLKVRGELNGCIGSIETDEPLGSSVARHAWSAAFSDPRLPQLRLADCEHLEVEISILSTLAPIPADSPDDLLDSLRPGVDGLLIAAGRQQAVFLPAVWEQIASAEMFVTHLFSKAGLAMSSWPADLQAFVFTAQKIRSDTQDRVLSEQQESPRTR